VNQCIVQLCTNTQNEKSSGELLRSLKVLMDINVFFYTQILEQWGEGKDLILELYDGSLRLVDEENNLVCRLIMFNRSHSFLEIIRLYQSIQLSRSIKNLCFNIFKLFSQDREQ